MAVSHLKSLTMADSSDTSLVRPSDWNSVHNQFYTLSGNTAGASTASGTNVVFSAAGGVTLGGSTGTIVFSAPTPATLSSFAPFELPGLASVANGAGTTTSGTVSLFPMTIDNYVAAAAMNLLASVNFITLGTSSGRQTNGYIFAMYTRGTGTNSTTLGTAATASFSMGVTGNNSTYTINYPADTNSAGYTTSTTSSAGVNLTSLFTGLKLIQFPIGQTLSPGIYWLGLAATKSTSSVNVGFSLSWLGATQSQTAIAPLNQHVSNFTTGTNMVGVKGGPWGQVHGSWTSAGNTTVPASIAISAVSAGVSMIPYMKFWST
jgi:hypothetical protein